MSIQLYVYVYAFILIIDWRLVTSERLKKSSDTRMRGRVFQAELDSNYRGIVEDALNSREGVNILARQEKDEKQHLRDSLFDQYQREYLEEEGPKKRGESEEPLADPRSLDRRSLFHHYNNSENVNEVLDTPSIQHLITQNDNEEKEHVFDALDEDYTYNEKQLHKAQEGILNKLTAGKIDQHANEEISQQGKDEISEQTGDEIEHQTNDAGANDDSKLEGQEVAEYPMKKNIVNNVTRVQNRNRLRHKKQLKRNSIVREANTRTKHAINKRLAEEDYSYSIKESLKGDLAQKIIAKGDEVERQEIMNDLREDKSYTQDLLSNIQEDLSSKMDKSRQQRNRVSSKQHQITSVTRVLDKPKGNHISKRLTEDDDEQSDFAKDQIAEEESREREHVLKAMSDDYSLDPMQIQLVEKQLLEKMQGNSENVYDTSLKTDIQNNDEEPNPENSNPDQGFTEETGSKRTTGFTWKPKSEGEEGLQAKGFELDDNGQKKGKVEDTGKAASAVDDAIKKAITAISKSLDGEKKKKKTIKEVFADHVANSDNEPAAAAVTAAAVASTLVHYKDEHKKDKDVGSDVDGKDHEGAAAATKKDSMHEKHRSPEDALQALLPEYHSNSNTSNYVMDDKGRLKEDTLSHPYADEDPFAETSRDDDSSLNTEENNRKGTSGEKKSLGNTEGALVHESIQRAVEPGDPMQMHDMERIMDHQNEVGYGRGIDKLSHDLVDEHVNTGDLAHLTSNAFPPEKDDDDQGDDDDDDDNGDNGDNEEDDDDDDPAEEDPDSKSNVPEDQNENYVMGADGIIRKEEKAVARKEVHKRHRHHHRRHRKQERGGPGGPGGEGPGPGGEGGGGALLSQMFQTGAKRHHHHHHHRHHHRRHDYYHVNQKPNHVFHHMQMGTENIDEESGPDGGLTFSGEIVNPCENGGVYVPAKLNHYNCICPMKFMGKKCSDVNYCHSDPCKNCGRCTLSHQWPHYVCECCLKYSGKHCEVPNPCEPNPCLNGGECTHDGKTPFCVCKNKFNGVTCENINNCNPNPCKNTGQCVQAKPPDNYICNCPYEWSGTTCEAQSHCASNPCQNEASCSEKENDFICECPEGYIGKRCARKLCTPNPCQNRGRCIEDGKDFHCICPSWVKGKTCSEVSPCLINPCKHNGRCVDIYSGFRWTLSPMQYYCLCPAPFRGPHCEVDQCKLCDPHAHCEIDHCVCDEGWSGEGVVCHPIPLPCHPNPCFNGGVCVDEGSGYFHCKCKFPYQRPNCQEIDVCKPDPCMNGECFASSDKDYKCVCHTGFTGKTCKDVDLCRPNPCQHGGTCSKVTERSFNCSCLGMWQGNLCEKCGCPPNTDGSRPNPYCSIMDYRFRACLCPDEWKYDIERAMCVKIRTSVCQQKEPCLFGGTCKEDPYSIEGYKCECRPENFGDTCEKTRYCTFIKTNPCVNGGTCLDLGPNKYKCLCLEGYRGINCSESSLASMMGGLNHCRPNPCEHNGVCIQIGNSYDCKCLTRYTGPQCGVDKCKDCDEHAKCVGGECICRYGYVGTGYECAPRECAKCADNQYCVQSQCICVPGYVKTANGQCKKGKLAASHAVTAPPKGRQKTTLSLLKTAHAKPTIKIARLSQPQHSNGKSRKPVLVHAISFLLHSKNKVTPGTTRSMPVPSISISVNDIGVSVQQQDINVHEQGSGDRQRDRNVHGQAINDLVEEGDDVKGLYKLEGDDTKGKKTNTSKLQANKTGTGMKGANNEQYHQVPPYVQNPKSVSQGEGITILIPTERNNLQSQQTMNSHGKLPNRQTAKPQNLPKKPVAQPHNKAQKPTEPHNKLQNQKAHQQQEKQQEINRLQKQRANQPQRKLPHQQQPENHTNTLQNQMAAQSQEQKIVQQRAQQKKQQQIQPQKKFQSQQLAKPQANILNQKTLQPYKKLPNQQSYQTSNKLQIQHKPQPSNKLQGQHRSQPSNELQSQNKPVAPNKLKTVQSHDNLQKQQTGGQKLPVQQTIQSKNRLQHQSQHQQTKPLNHTLQGQKMVGPHTNLQNQKTAQPHHSAETLQNQKVQNLILLMHQEKPQANSKQLKVPQHAMLLLHKEAPQATNNPQNQQQTITHNKFTKPSTSQPPVILQSQTSLQSHQTLQKQAVHVQKFQNKLTQKQVAKPSHETQNRTPAKPRLQSQATTLPHKSQNQLLARPTSKIQNQQKPQPSNKLKQVPQPQNQMQPHRGVVNKAAVHGKPLNQQKVGPRVMLQNKAASIPHNKLTTPMATTLHNKLDNQRIAQLHSKNATNKNGTDMCNEFGAFLNPGANGIRTRDGKMSPQCKEQYMKALWDKLQTKLKRLWSAINNTKSKSKSKAGVYVLAHILSPKTALVTPPFKAQTKVNLVTPQHSPKTQSKVSLVTPPNVPKTQSKVSLVTPPHSHNIHPKVSLVTPPHSHKMQPKESLVMPPHSHKPQAKESLITEPHSHKAQPKESLVTTPHSHKAQPKESSITTPHSHKAQPKESLITTPHSHEAQPKESLVSASHAHKVQPKESVVTAPHKTQLKTNLSPLSHEREDKMTFDTLPHQMRVNVSYVMLPRKTQHNHMPTYKILSVKNTKKSHGYESKSNNDKQINNGVAAALTKLLETNHLKEQYRNRKLNVPYTYNDLIRLDLTPKNLLTSHHRFNTSRPHNMSLLEYDAMLNRKWLAPADTDNLDVSVNVTLDDDEEKRPKHKHGTTKHGEGLRTSGSREGIKVPLIKVNGLSNNDDILLNTNATMNATNNASNSYGEQEQSSNDNSYALQLNDDDTKLFGDSRVGNTTKNNSRGKEHASPKETNVLTNNKLVEYPHASSMTGGLGVSDNAPIDSHLSVSLPNQRKEELIPTSEDEKDKEQYLETKFEIDDLPDNSDNIKKGTDNSVNYNRHAKKGRKTVRHARRETLVLTNNPFEKESARRHDLALGFQKLDGNSYPMEKKISGLDNLLMKDRDELDYSTHLIPGEDTGEMGLVDDNDDMNFELSDDDLTGNYVSKNRSTSNSQIVHKYVVSQENKKRMNPQLSTARKDVLNLKIALNQKVEDASLTVFGDRVLPRKRILSFGSDKVSHFNKEESLQVNHKVDNKLTSLKKEDKAQVDKKLTSPQKEDKVQFDNKLTSLKKENKVQVNNKLTSLKKEDKAQVDHKLPSLKKEDKAQVDNKFTSLKKEDKARGLNETHEYGNKRLYYSHNRNDSVNVTKVPQGSLKNNKVSVNNFTHVNINNGSNKEHKDYTTPSKTKSHKNEKPTSSSHQLRSTERIDQKHVTKKASLKENVEKNDAAFLNFQMDMDSDDDDNDMRNKNSKSMNGENTRNKNSNSANKNKLSASYKETKPLKQTSPKKDPAFVLTNRKANKLVPDLFRFQVYDDATGINSHQNNKRINSKNGGTTSKNDRRNKTNNPVEYPSHRNGSQKINHTLHSGLHLLTNKSSEGSINKSNHVESIVFDLNKMMGVRTTKKIPTRKASTKSHITGKTSHTKPRTREEKTDDNLPPGSLATNEAIYPHIAEAFDSDEGETLPTQKLKNSETQKLRNNSTSNTSLHHEKKLHDKINMSNIDYMLRYNGTEIDRFRLHDEDRHVTFLNDLKPESSGAVEDIEGHSYNKGSKLHLVDARPISTDDDITNVVDSDDTTGDMFTLKFHYNDKRKDTKTLTQDREEHPIKRQFTINNAVAKQPNDDIDTSFFNLQLDDS